MSRGPSLALRYEATLAGGRRERLAYWARMHAAALGIQCEEYTFALEAVQRAVIQAREVWGFLHYVPILFSVIDVTRTGVANQHNIYDVVAFRHVSATPVTK
jgi:hypothetical protein